MRMQALKAAGRSRLLRWIRMHSLPIALLATVCPNAKVVYDDLFHVIYNYGRLVISTIRIRLANAFKENNDEIGYQLLKRSRSILLTRNSNLTEDRKIRLDDILRHYKELYAANELKELLPEVFNTTSKE